MAGDPANAPVWSEGDVYIGALTATIPTTNAAFALNATSGGTSGVVDKWDFVGLLDDDSPFDNGAETIDKTDHSAFGYGVIATTYKNQKETFTFTALETTLKTLGLLYDATGVTDTSGNLAGDLKRRDPSKTFRVAVERRNGTPTIERKISKNYAYIDDLTRNFADGKSTYTVTVVIVPSATDVLFYYYNGDPA